MDVAQRLQELRAFDGNLHSYFRPIQQIMSWECRAVHAAADGTRSPDQRAFRGA